MCTVTVNVMSCATRKTNSLMEEIVTHTEKSCVPQTTVVVVMTTGHVIVIARVVRLVVVTSRVLFE